MVVIFHRMPNRKTYDTITAQFLAVNGTRWSEMWRILSDACRLLGRKKAYETVSNGAVVTQRRGNRRKNASLTETGPFSHEKRSAGKQCAFFPPHSLPFSRSPLCPSFFHSSTYFFDPRSNPRPRVFLGIRSSQSARVPAIVAQRVENACVEDFGN